MCDCSKSRRLRSIAGWKATTQRANYGSGPTTVMPGCDTRELCQKIQSEPELAAVRILLITSLPEVEAAEHARELGAVAALTKELGIPTVVARVRAVLKETA